MARNRNHINQGNRLMLQGMKGYYLAPKEPLEVEKDFPNYQNMSINELKNELESKNKFVDIDNDVVDKLSWYQENGVAFQFRDGKSDVYTKGGYDTQMFEYLDRQYGESIKWRIETNATIDFIAGGKILLGNKEMTIVKVLNIITSGTRENKFLAMRNFNNLEKYATKMLALI